MVKVFLFQLLFALKEPGEIDKADKKRNLYSTELNYARRDFHLSRACGGEKRV